MIFYFSGTGNTRWVADHVAKATGERLCFIPAELHTAATQPCRYRLERGERLGFCFPVHGWQPPHIVRTFIERLAIESDSTPPYTYAVCTCGDQAGLAMKMLDKDLRRRGLPTTTSRFSLQMPETYVALPFMYTDTPEREKEKIAVAREQLDVFTEMICQRREGETHVVEGPLPWVLSHVIGAFFNRWMISDKKFTVDTDACIHCGKCQQACPTGDVQLAEGLPHWQHDGSCTCCLSCYHHCPRHAINYGRITRKREQYFFGHPQSDVQP